MSRYTHRIAISNQRLISLDERGVTFAWKDYRVEGRTRNKMMTLAADQFVRRLLLHVRAGFHRIRHYGARKPITAQKSSEDMSIVARSIRGRRSFRRSIVIPLSANLRLSTLWIADDHHRHAVTNQTYPSATSGTMSRMNAITSWCTDRLSALQQGEPIAGASAPVESARWCPEAVLLSRSSLRDLLFTQACVHHASSATDQIPIDAKGSGRVEALRGFLPRGL